MLRKNNRKYPWNVKISMECKRNPKKFWHYINRKPTTKTGVGDPQWKDLNGSVVFADSDNATALLQFFPLYILLSHMMNLTVCLI